jgi:hypothetical protein
MAKITIPCLHCKTPFVTYRRYVEHNGKKFCSRPCQYEWRRRPDVRNEQFWAQVNKTDSCWLWTGWKLNSGYGESTFQGRKMTVHRYSYTLAHGPIPAGKHVLHRCDVPTCVNPDHLFLGKDADNVRDKVSKGREARGEMSASAKLTEEKVRAIRAEYWGGKRAQPSNAVELSAKYGVTRGTIVFVALGRSWTHVK